MDAMVSYEAKKKYNIITEYNPDFCDLYIEYANSYINPDGFWGEYKIDESMKDVWIKTHPRFKQTVALIPNITTHILNQSMSQIIKVAEKIGDIKTITQLTLKMMEFSFKVSKEGGEIKDKARTNKLAKDNSEMNVDEGDEQLAREYSSKIKTNEI